MRPREITVTIRMPDRAALDRLLYGNAFVKRRAGRPDRRVDPAAVTITRAAGRVVYHCEDRDDETETTAP